MGGSERQRDRERVGEREKDREGGEERVTKARVKQWTLGERTDEVNVWGERKRERGKKERANRQKERQAGKRRESGREERASER